MFYVVVSCPAGTYPFLPWRDNISDCSVLPGAVSVPSTYNGDLLPFQTPVRLCASFLSNLC